MNRRLDSPVLRLLVPSELVLDGAMVLALVLALRADLRWPIPGILVVTLFAVALLARLAIDDVIRVHRLFASVVTEDTEDAEARADALLAQHLTAAQREELARHSWVTVQSPSQPRLSYRLYVCGLVDVYVDGHRAYLDLCVSPTTWVPRADRLLTHKLMIEANERNYLRTANWLVRTGGSPLVTAAALEILRQETGTNRQRNFRGGLP